MLDGWFGGFSMSMCVFFFLFSFFLEREMEGDEPYHDRGRVVGISLESQRGLERDGEYCQYTKYHARQKKKKK